MPSPITLTTDDTAGHLAVEDASRRLPAFEDRVAIQTAVQTVLATIRADDTRNGTNLHRILTARMHAASCAEAARDIGMDYKPYQRAWYRARARFIELWTQFGYRY